MWWLRLRCVVLLSPSLSKGEGELHSDHRRASTMFVIYKWNLISKKPGRYRPTMLSPLLWSGILKPKTNKYKTTPTLSPDSSSIPTTAGRRIERIAGAACAEIRRPHPLFIYRVSKIIYLYIKCKHANVVLSVGFEIHEPADCCIFKVHVSNLLTWLHFILTPKCR